MESPNPAAKLRPGLNAYVARRLLASPRGLLVRECAPPKATPLELSAVNTVLRELERERAVEFVGQTDRWYAANPRKLRRLCALAEEVAAARPNVRAAPGVPTRDRIVQVLTGSTSLLSPTEISLEADLSLNNVWFFLNRLVERGDVERVERGKYRLRGMEAGGG